ncbi:terminase [Altererythrobacter xixiisoli]|uniref:Terminase n=1 Tax=Croceibacterium xixiisoli TaxID=1476466 RepID=A0A6I4TZI0_9SPHN|nr:phage terminase small subunit [Croceibacterium xixiisoli]MXP00472.1 terminase [Croceibacterium xixiisoli]
MSLARRHRDRILAAQTAASAPDGGAVVAPAAAPLPAAGAHSAPANASPADTAARQIALRLTHDLRRLKEIRSIDKKIAAKREMLPEYASWVAGLLQADAGVGAGIAAEVAPTMMVWLIDTGDFDQALTIGEFLLRHRVEMPSRYQRDAATVIAEEIAEAAQRLQNAGHAFALDVLDRAFELVADRDIHDPVMAKLHKVIGIEQLRAAEDLPAADSAAALDAALFSLSEAQRLNERVGVKDRIKRTNKLRAAITPPTTKQGGAAA